MSFCPFCGFDAGDGAFCSRCGRAVNDTSQFPVYEQPLIPDTVEAQPVDAPSKGFAVLGFFFPLVGLILYLVHHDSKPKRAASAGKGALWGVICPAIVIVGVIFLTFLVVHFSNDARNQKAYEESLKTATSAATTTTTTTTAEHEYDDFFA